MRIKAGSNILNLGLVSFCGGIKFKKTKINNCSKISYKNKMVNHKSHLLNQKLVG